MWVTGDNLKFAQAIIANDIDSAKLLLKNPGVDPAFLYNNSLVHITLMKGMREMTVLLVEDGRCEVNANDDFVLRQAVIKNWGDVVRALLLDARTNPCANGHEAFKMACKHGSVQIVRLLLSALCKYDYWLSSDRWNNVVLRYKDIRRNRDCADRLQIHPDCIPVIALDPHVGIVRNPTLFQDWRDEIEVYARKEYARVLAFVAKNAGGSWPDFVELLSKRMAMPWD